MAKDKKIVKARLIANPGSGTSADRGKLIEKAARCLKDLGMEIDVAVAKPKEKAIPIARKAVKNGYKVIIAMGGDDTVEAVIRGIAGSKARLGIIPVGTANNLAKCLGIPEDVEQACALIAAGNVRRLDMGEVKLKKGKKLPFFELVCLGIGAAIYPDALRASKRKKLLPSLRGAIHKAITHDSKPKVTVKMDGDSNITIETMLAIVSNVPLIGPNMLVVPDASMEDGLFDISLYPNFTKAELLAYTTRTMGANPPQDGKIQRYRARKIQMKSTPKLEVMADGIMLGKGKFKIKVLPRALRVFAPEVGAGVEKPPEAAGADLPAPVSPVVEV
jgi:diacylglycerol kinase (ATP)